jgi:hypothetical protein
LASAQTAVERLTDYTFEENNNRRTQQLPSGSANKTFRPVLSKSGGGAESKLSSFGGIQKITSNLRDTAMSKSASSTYVLTPRPFYHKGYRPRLLSCFLYNGFHRVDECPHKISLSALQAAIHAKEAGDEHETNEEPSHMSALRFLGAVEKQAKTHEQSQ